MERHRTNARNDPATQREYPYFRPLNLNAGAILTGSGEDGRSGGRRGREEVRAVTGGHGVGKGKRGRSGRNDSSPLRSLPTSRSLSRPISRKRVKRASKNARQTRPFTSPGIAHSCSHRFFSSLSFPCLFVAVHVHASVRSAERALFTPRFQAKRRFANMTSQGEEGGEEGKEKHARGAKRNSISRNVLEGSWGRGVTITNLSRSVRVGIELRMSKPGPSSASYREQCEKTRETRKKR